MTRVWNLTRTRQRPKVVDQVEMSAPPTVSDPELPQRPRRAWLAVALVVLAIMAIAGFGYWNLVYYPSTPQYTLDKFFVAAKVRDYDALYSLVHVSGLLKVAVPNAKALREMAQQMPGPVPEVE